MKKIVILLLITTITAFGCTKIPKSVETGVMPGEYDGLTNSDELKKENESLSKELEAANAELEKLKEAYLSLTEGRDVTLKKLGDAESILDVLQNNELPKFTLENTDKINISNYLNEKKSIMDKISRSIEIIPLVSNENIILYRMIGYGENYNQLFAWEIGKNEPIMIAGAHYNKDGSWKWLVQDKYILINSTNTAESEKIIVDVEGMKAINTFKSNSDVYLIPNTASIIMQKAIEGSSSFVIYNFITSEEKEIALDFQNKNLKFETDDENKEIKFKGTYKDANETEYSVQAVISIEKLKEKYAIKTLEESITQKNSVD